VFEDPKKRQIVLKGVLAISGVIMPICAIIIFYVFCYIVVLDGIDPHIKHFHKTELLKYIVIILVIISIFLLNINLTSPHRLYRDQLAKTFILSDENKDVAVQLKDLNATNHAPYHLINTTANFPSSESPALRDRKCDFFLFSKHWCGSPATGYHKTEDWKTNGKPPDLATAMAISGAAVSPLMGLGSFPSLGAPLTFSMFD
jgi:hypothetical protein